MYVKRTLHGYFTGKLPKFLLHFFLRTNFIKTARQKLVTKLRLGSSETKNQNNNDLYFVEKVTYERMTGTP